MLRTDQRIIKDVSQKLEAPRLFEHTHSQYQTTAHPVCWFCISVRELPPTQKPFICSDCPRNLVIYTKKAIVQSYTCWCKPILKNMMPIYISELAGLSAKYTSHSLLATAVTIGRVSSYGIPETVIAKVTGHESLKYLGKRRSTEQVQAVGKAI